MTWDTGRKSWVFLLLINSVLQSDILARCVCTWIDPHGWIVYVWKSNQSSVSWLEVELLLSVSLINSWNALHCRVLLPSCERLKSASTDGVCLLKRPWISMQWASLLALSVKHCYRYPFFSLLSLLLVFYVLICHIHFNHHEHWKTLVLQCCFWKIKISWKLWFKIQSSIIATRHCGKEHSLSCLILSAFSFWHNEQDNHSSTTGKICF